MKLVFYLVLFCSLLKPINGQELIGFWYTPGLENGYEELYVNDSSIVTCGSYLLNCGLTYDYTLTKDSIFLYYDDILHQSMKYEYHNCSDTLVLFFNDFTYTYVREKPTFSDYFSISSEDEYKIFMEEFRKRAVISGAFSVP
jgi:hypothetical protein